MVTLLGDTAMTPAITLPPLPVRSNIDSLPDLGQLASELAESLQQYETGIKQFEESYNEICQLADEGRDFATVPDAVQILLNRNREMAEEHIRKLWNRACELMEMDQRHLAKWRESSPHPIRDRFLAAITSEMEQLAELMRTMAVVWEELELETPDDIYETVWTFYVPPLAYLRAMWNLFWSSIRHPLSDTVIELKTGRILRQG
jgi:hypothetical protein